MSERIKKGMAISSIPDALLVYIGLQLERGYDMMI